MPSGKKRAVTLKPDHVSRASALLWQDEELLRSMWENSADAMVLSDPQGVVIAANPAYLELYGYTAEEVVGSCFAIIFPREVRDWAVGQYRVNFESEQTAPWIESTIRRKDGSERVVEARYSFVTQAGRRIAMFSMIRDITERKLVEQQKDEFIALASHELKTPLTAIKGYSQSLLRRASKLGIEDERVLHILRTIDGKANFINDLINELLDVSRVERGQFPLQREQFNLTRLARECASSLRLTAPEFEIVCSAGDSTNMVYADRHRVEQVISNLVNNAVKYSGDSRRVEIETAAEDSEAIVSVRDYGLGIPADQQARVFRRFFRARNVSSTEHSGLGLGLYIAHGIIARHQGRMWVESAEGQGSTFFFSLPLSPYDDSDDSDDGEG